MRRKTKIGLVIASVAIAATAVWLIQVAWMQASQGRFGIYLSDNNKLVISDKDIVWYNKTSHELKLTEEGANKITALRVPVYGKFFVVKLYDRNIYNGSFWSPISSIPYSGIAIETTVKDNIVKIEKGYPTSKFFQGVDPRDNSEIFSYFEKIGKLTR